MNALEGIVLFYSYNEGANRIGIESFDYIVEMKRWEEKGCSALYEDAGFKGDVDCREDEIYTALSRIVPEFNTLHDIQMDTGLSEVEVKCAVMMVSYGTDSEQFRLFIRECNENKEWDGEIPPYEHLWQIPGNLMYHITDTVRRDINSSAYGASHSTKMDLNEAWNAAMATDADE